MDDFAEGGFTRFSELSSIVFCSLKDFKLGYLEVSGPRMEYNGTLRAEEANFEI